MYQYQVSFGDAIRRAFTNYCNFSGRASRSEYWWFYLFNIIISYVLAIPGGVFNFAAILNGQEPTFNFFSIMTYVWGLFTFLPSFGLFFRRLHDTGRSGWWWLLGFIPLIGAIILIVWLCQASQQGQNQYGPEPNMTEGPAQFK